MENNSKQSVALRLYIMDVIVPIVLTLIFGVIVLLANSQTLDRLGEIQIQNKEILNQIRRERITKLQEGLRNHYYNEHSKRLAEVGNVE